MSCCWRTYCSVKGHHHHRPTHSELSCSNCIALCNFSTSGHQSQIVFHLRPVGRYSTIRNMATSICPSTRRPGGTASSLLLLCMLLMSTPSRLFVSSFQPAWTTSPLSPSIGTSTGRSNPHQHSYTKSNHQPLNNRWESPTPEGSSTSLNSFMGSDGGLFGIGTPELVRRDHD